MSEELVVTGVAIVARRRWGSILDFWVFAREIHTASFVICEYTIPSKRSILSISSPLRLRGRTTPNIGYTRFP